MLRHNCIIMRANNVCKSVLQCLLCNKLPFSYFQVVRRDSTLKPVLAYRNLSTITPNPRSRLSRHSRDTTFITQDSVTKHRSAVVSLSTSSISKAWIWKGMGDMQSQQVPGLADTTRIQRPGKINLTDAEWKAKLTPEQYSVCRKHGTERAWTGDLLDNKHKGFYTCACCGINLFHSSTKFDSGSGWPSFFDTLKDKDVETLPAVDLRQDSTHGMIRTEVLCGKCDAHLGHVFTDGPQPTGLRYCINSVCLKFKRGGESSGGNDNSNHKSDL